MKLLVYSISKSKKPLLSPLTNINVPTELTK